MGNRPSGLRASMPIPKLVTQLALGAQLAAAPKTMGSTPRSSTDSSCSYRADLHYRLIAITG